MASGPEAGWYLDPEVPGQQRYWNGEEWTEHRAPSAAATAGLPDGTAIVGVRRSQGASLGAIIFGLVLVALILGIVVDCSGGSDSPQASYERDPGKGGSIADKVYGMVDPKVGEPLVPLDESDPKMFLLERVIEVGEVVPGWVVVDQPNTVGMDVEAVTEPGARARVDKYVFADGSALLFVGVPIGGEGSGEGLYLDHVGIER